MNHETCPTYGIGSFNGKKEVIFKPDYQPPLTNGSALQAIGQM